MIIEKVHYRLEEWKWALSIKRSEYIKQGDKMKSEVFKLAEHIINVLKDWVWELAYIKFQVMEFLARKNPKLLYWLLRKNEFHPALNINPIVVERFRKKYGLNEWLKKYFELLAKIREAIHQQDLKSSKY